MNNLLIFVIKKVDRREKGKFPSKLMKLLKPEFRHESLFLSNKTFPSLIPCHMVFEKLVNLRQAFVFACFGRRKRIYVCIHICIRTHIYIYVFATSIAFLHMH